MNDTSAMSTQTGVPGWRSMRSVERRLQLGHRRDVELAARDDPRLVALAHLEPRDVLHLV